MFPQPGSTGFDTYDETMRRDELSRLNDRLANGTFVDSAGDDGDSTPGETYKRIWIRARITARSSGHPFIYSWTEVEDIGNGYSFAAVPWGHTGTDNASEINQFASVPIGAVVWLWRTEGDTNNEGNASGWQFAHCCREPVVSDIGSGTCSFSFTAQGAPPTAGTDTGRGTASFSFTAAAVNASSRVILDGFTFQAPSVTTFDPGSTLVFNGPTWNVTDSTQLSISTGETLQVSGPGLFSFDDGTLQLAGFTSGASILKAPATGGGTLTFPAGTTTIAGLGTAQTWTGVQSFTNGTMVLLGSSSDSSTLQAPATGGGTVTLPAGSVTLAGTGVTNYTGTTTTAYATIFDVTVAAGYHGSVVIKNTHASFSLTAQITITDMYGTATILTPFNVTFGNKYCVEVDHIVASNSPNATGPIKEVKLELKSTVAGNHATYDVYESHVG